MDHSVDLFAALHSINPRAFESAGLVPPLSGQTDRSNSGLEKRDLPQGQKLAKPHG
jgi:hypothetical protein